MEQNSDVNSPEMDETESDESTVEHKVEETAQYSDEFRELIRERLARHCTVVKDEQGEEHLIRTKKSPDGTPAPIKLIKKIGVLTFYFTLNKTAATQNIR